MKKNGTLKLSLSRETLRQLDAAVLQTAVPGGETAGCTVQGDSKSCFNTCSCQVCPGGTNLTC